MLLPEDPEEAESSLPTPVNLTPTAQENPPLPKIGSAPKDRNYRLWFGVLIVILIISFAIFFFLKRGGGQPQKANSPSAATSSATPPTTTEKKQIGYVNSDVGLNLRTDASTNSKILQSLPNGTELSILSESGDWYLVEATTRGYVAKQYVTATKPTRVLKIYDASGLNFKFIYPEDYKISVTHGDITAFQFQGTGDNSGGFSVSKVATGTTIAGYLADKYPTATSKDCDITIGNASDCKMVTKDQVTFYLAVAAGAVYKFDIPANYGNFPSDLTAIIFPSLFFAQ